jgi:hypothetical protein
MEELDTPAAPPDVPGSEPVADPPPAEPIEPVSPPEPPALTTDQIMEQASEKAFQKIASWQGRRDKYLFNALGDMIEKKVSNIQQQAEPLSSVDYLNNPEGWARIVVPKILNEEISKQTHAEQKFTSEVIRVAGGMMDGDPLFADKALGKDVITEIQKNFGNLDRKIPPNMAARFLINDAVTSVYRKKSGQKPNALAGNVPGKVHGSINPPASAAKASPVKLSDAAEKLAKRWGYSTEDISKVFKESA